MTPSRLYSAAITGLDAKIVEVETDVAYGMPSFEIVGLADKAVQESKERIRAAIKSIKFAEPSSRPQKILVNLAPADIKKEGSLYDLPIAMGFLLASQQTQFDPEDKLFLGELALNGQLRPVKGSLCAAIMARDSFKEIILPKANAMEASFVIQNERESSKCLKIIGANTLRDVIDHLEGRKIISPTKASIDDLANQEDVNELQLIRGQEYAKRALEITAAGSHNLLMTGPPGAGKTLLAKALPSLMPPLTFDESIEVTKIYSIAGLLSQEQPFILKRPFRSPHHTASEVALVGGGNPPRPGEITLAHRGILFLDEFPEFHRDTLESLRQPIEEGKISILRAKQFLSLPSRFSLVASANPCPCGYLNDEEKQCVCLRQQLQMYQRKLSGPLIDRIDILIEVPRLKYEKLAIENEEQGIISTKEKIELAREIQLSRFRKDVEAKNLVNSEMTLGQIKRHCQVDPSSQTLLKRFVDSGKLSARGYHKVLKIARTIADLDGEEKISYDHVAEALMYRVKEN